jgi:hypothetical protein
MRIRFLKFLVRGIFNRDPEQRLPLFLLPVKWFLFPIEAICSRYAPIKYDLSTDIFTIEGMRYSRDLFRSLAEAGIAEGHSFGILKKKNGKIIIEDRKEG